MLSLSKHLARAARGTNLTARARCFDTLSMTDVLLCISSYFSGPLLLMKATRLLSGDHEGVFMVPWPP